METYLDDAVWHGSLVQLNNLGVLILKLPEPLREQLHVSVGTSGVMTPQVSFQSNILGTV